MSESVSNALPVKLVEDWGDIVDTNEFMYDSDGFGLAPISYYSNLRDRSDGRYLPVYQHEMDLRHIRAMSWLLSERVPMAQAWVNRLLDYTVGTGFDWSITHSNPQLQIECRKAIEEATDNSHWSSDLERETYSREIIDGEWLGELKCDGGQICIVTREADELTEPSDKKRLERWIGFDEDYEKKSWSFGVLTNVNSTEIPIGYHFVRNQEGTDWDYVDCGEALHWKRNVRSKAKRGVSDFYKPHQYLMRADRVLTNTAEGAATQAAIAYIVEHPQGATQANARAIQDRYAPATGRIDPRTGEQQRKRRMAPNTRIDTPAGAKYHASLLGSNASVVYVQVMEAALRLAGTVHAFPEGMLTGSYANNNFASSLTAESPFVQGRVAEQFHRASRIKEMFAKILKLAANRGRFRRAGVDSWDDVRLGLEIEIQPAKVFPKNIKETTDALVIQKAQGWVDDKSAMTELGRDYDAVRAQQKLEKQTASPAGQDPNQELQDGGDTAEPTPSGIYSQISRQQWIRNGKAIQDVVGNLVNGTTTPVLAAVMLNTLGLDEPLAQKIVDDVQSRGQESFRECEKILSKNLLEEQNDEIPGNLIEDSDDKLAKLLEMVTPFRLVEGGPGSGIDGHRTERATDVRPSHKSAKRTVLRPKVAAVPAKEQTQQGLNKLQTSAMIKSFNDSRQSTGYDDATLDSFCVEFAADLKKRLTKEGVPHEVRSDAFNGEPVFHTYIEVGGGAHFVDASGIYKSKEALLTNFAKTNDLDLSMGTKPSAEGLDLSYYE